MKTPRLKMSGSHTAQATRFVLRRLEAGKTQLEVLEELQERGCSEDRAEALLLGAIVAYDGLFAVDSRLQLEARVAAEGLSERSARLVVHGVLSDLERIVGFAVPIALEGNRAQLVPRLRQRLGLSFRSARAFTKLVITIVDRVLLELGGAKDTFPFREDVLDQLQAERQPRLIASRVVSRVFGYFEPVRAAG